MPVSTISQAGLDAPISLTSPTLTTPNIDSAQIPTVSGTAPLYMCRAWVNFNGTTNVGGFCTIRASGNVTSITDDGTGNYYVNFTTAMPDANYAFSCATGRGGVPIASGFSANITTTSLRVSTQDAGGVYADTDTILVAIFR